MADCYDKVTQEIGTHSSVREGLLICWNNKMRDPFEKLDRGGRVSKNFLGGTTRTRDTQCAEEEEESEIGLYPRPGFINATRTTFSLCSSLRRATNVGAIKRRTEYV